MKKIKKLKIDSHSHWVGDGFPVRTIFSYNDFGNQSSPFLLMDYAGPADFKPSFPHRRGVESHPHRGFETVTIVYSGQVEHRDSAGGGGIIFDDEVQWMTAGSGLVHEEKHGVEFAKSGGHFEMVQLWVNLPAKSKMTKPRYQAITKQQIISLPLENNSGVARIIAGSFRGVQGPAKTFSYIDLWDLRLNKSVKIQFDYQPGRNLSVFVLEGEVEIEGAQLKSAQLGILDTESEKVEITSLEKSKILILGGDPLNEPIVGYGPFVMNTKEEIVKAFQDFEQGKMGSIEPIEGSSF